MDRLTKHALISGTLAATAYIITDILSDSLGLGLIALVLTAALCFRDGLKRGIFDE